VLSFATFRSSRASVRYYVERGADCHRVIDGVTGALSPAAASAGRAVDYYTDHGDTDGVWLGAGAAALGLAGPIRGDQVRVFERLLAGQLPDGTVLARPVWRPHPAGRLSARPLIDVIEQRAAAGGLSVEELLASPDAR
jgi:hypothetical protein